MPNVYAANELLTPMVDRHPASTMRTMAQTTPNEDYVITQALAILRSRLGQRDTFRLPADVKAFLRLKAQGLDHEVFGAMFLDAQNRLIAYERLFRGTLTHTAVHPRELVKRALAHNAAGLILHHNHPSGCCTPSLRDDSLTFEIRRALEPVEVQVFDHVITSDEDAVSMMELGLM